MSKSKKTKIKSYATAGDGQGEPFAQIGQSLIFSKTFQELKPVCQNFYLKLIVWKHSSSHCDELVKALTRYYSFKNQVSDHITTDDEIKQEAYCTSRSKPSLTFVVPQSGLEEMGYSVSNGSKLLDQLRMAGFIRVKSSGRNRQAEDGHWGHIATIWEFSTAWKRIESGEPLTARDKADMKAKTK